MTNQEAFDTMVKHLRKQGCKSRNITGNCLYRGPNGTRCAVGCLIPDSEYSFEMEMDVGSLVHEFNPKCLRGLDIGFLRKMQDIHDRHHPCEWESQFSIVASRFEFTVPPLEAA